MAVRSWVDISLHRKAHVHPMNGVCFYFEGTQGDEQDGSG